LKIARRRCVSGETLTRNLDQYSRLAFAAILALLGAVILPAATAQTSGGVIEGRVLDPTNAPLSGALVTAENISGGEVCRTESSAEGQFTCTALLPGEYKLSVSSSGFRTYTSEHVRVEQGHPSANLQVTLKLVVENTEVTVSATSQEVAQEQIRAAEKQRIIGIVPNFYTSYFHDAVPLSSKQKYSLAFRDVLDPFTFLSAGASAGVEQAHNSYKGYGQGAAGYGKRFAAAYGDGLTSDVFRHAVYASLFHQDPRYFYQGTGTVRSRFLHAISFAVALRGNDGSVKPNYSYVAGYLTSGALSNAYYPHADRGVGLVFTRALFGVAGTAGEGLLREFVFNHLTTNRHSVP
jgi:hypothetical protein